MAEIDLGALQQSIANGIAQGVREGVAAANRTPNSNTATNRSSRDFSPSSSFGGNKKDSVLGNPAGAASSQLGQAINNAGGSINQLGADLTKATPLISGLSSEVGGLIGYLEETQDTFKALSKVGAGLEGRLGELRMAAAETGMPLKDFANMVGRNSEQLAGFAGGVTGGIKVFRDLSKTIREDGTLEGFMNLGYTLEETNEFVLKNLEVQRRDARFRNADGSVNSKLMLENSLQMAKSLDVMAKVAGKDLKQMQDDNIARMRDGATQAKLRLMEQRGVAGATDAYQKSLVSLGAAPKVAKDLLKDLVQTGVPMSDATKAFAATNKEAYTALVQQANAIKQGKVEEAEALGKKATAASIAYANSEQGLTLATLGQLSPIAKQQADNLEQVGPLIDQIKERAKQIGEPLTDTASYVRTFNDIIKQTADITGAQTSGGVKGQELSRELNNIQADIARSASKINESIGKFLDSNTALISGVSAVADKLSQILSVSGAAGAANPSLATPNSSNVLTSRNIEDPELARIAQGIESGSVQGAAREAAIQKLVDLGVMDSTGKIISKVRTRSLGGGFERGDILKVGEQGPETMIAGMDGAIIPNMKGMLNRLPKMAKDLQDTLTNSIDPTAIQAKITDKFDPTINDGGKAYRPGEREYAEQAAAEGNKRSLAKFNADFDRAMANTSSSIASNFSPDITEVMPNRSDTSSNTNFPDLSEVLNGVPDIFKSLFSSVVPDMTKTMQQGMPDMKNMVAKMPDSIKQLQKEITTIGASANNAAKSPALLPEIKGASSSDIGTLIKHAELTNELLSQLLGVNTTQVRVGEKQLRTVRSSGNLMNGIGRA